MNWRELATTSHYETAVAIGERLNAGDVQDARQGVDELIESLARAERRALRSQIVRLMAHVIKWKSQPHRSSQRWAATIISARHEIKWLKEEEPSLTDDMIRQKWDRCFEHALIEASAEIDVESSICSLTWQEVFEVEYQNAPPPRGK